MTATNNATIEALELSSQLMHLSNFLHESAAFYPETAIAELQEHQFGLIEQLHGALMTINQLQSQQTSQLEATLKEVI